MLVSLVSTGIMQTKVTAEETGTMRVHLGSINIYGPPSDEDAGVYLSPSNHIGDDAIEVDREGINIDFYIDVTINLHLGGENGWADNAIATFHYPGGSVPRSTGDTLGPVEVHVPHTIHADPEDSFTFHLEGILTDYWGAVTVDYDYQPVYVDIVGPVNEGPSRPSTPSGPSRVAGGTTVTFTSSSTDPEGDDIRYRWEWTGGSSGWSNCHSSGSTVSKSITFPEVDEQTNVKVKVQARDFPPEGYDAVTSDWSQYKELILPYNNPYNSSNCSIYEMIFPDAEILDPETHEIEFFAAIFGFFVDSTEDGIYDFVCYDSEGNFTEQSVSYSSGTQEYTVVLVPQSTEIPAAEIDPMPLN
jgi:hypothetical protein